jgi:hypothetical protein
MVQWGTGVKTNAKGGADAQLGERQWMWHHSWKSRDVVPNASFTRHEVSYCAVDITVITELCISAAYRISSSGSSLKGSISTKNQFHSSFSAGTTITAGVRIWFSIWKGLILLAIKNGLYHSFSSVAHVCLHAAKTTGPISKKFVFS